MQRLARIDSTGAQILIQTWNRVKAAGQQPLFCGQDDQPNTAALLRDHGAK